MLSSARNLPRRSVWDAAPPPIPPAAPQRNSPRPAALAADKKGRPAAPFLLREMESRRSHRGRATSHYIRQDHETEGLMSRMHENPTFDWADPLLLEDMRSEEERIGPIEGRVF